MPSPTLSSGPTPAEMASVTDPFQRAALITEMARRCGTLPRALFQIRRDALAELRQAEHSARVIAERVGLSRSRVFQLTRPAAAQEATS